MKGVLTSLKNKFQFENCISKGSNKFIIYDLFEDGIWDDGGYMVLMIAFIFVRFCSSSMFVRDILTNVMQCNEQFIFAT